jgi:hypothetical protein
MNNLAVNLFCKSIFLYTKIQLFIIRCKTKYNNLISVIDYLCGNDIDVVSEDTNNYLYYIKDGNVIDYYIEGIKEENNNIIYDFIVYEVNHNKILYEKEPINKRSIELVSYKFIQVEVIFENNNLFIQLSKDEYNYYITNNFIDSNFLLYFLRKHYSKEVEKYNNEYLMKYTINIIDYNVNIITVDNTKKITFCKNDYLISEKNQDTIEEECVEYEIIKENNIIEENNKITDILLEAQNKKVTDSMIFTKNEIINNYDSDFDDFVMNYES